MSRKLFLIKLKDAHDRSGKTIYQAAKESGLVYNTVRKYVLDYVQADKLTPEALHLAEFYGVDWRDPSVIEIIEEGDDTQPIDVIDDRAPLAILA